MADRFSPDQLFAYVAHWRGVLDEQALLALEERYEQVLDEGDYVPLADLAVHGKFISPSTREVVESWYPLAELRFEGAWLAQQMLQQGVPQEEINAAFAEQERAYASDGTLTALSKILLDRGVITTELLASLEPLPDPEDEGDDDADADDVYDAGAAASDHGDELANEDWSDTQIRQAAGGLLDMVLSVSDGEDSFGDLLPDDEDDAGDEPPDLLAMQQRMRDAAAGGADPDETADAGAVDRVPFSPAPDATPAPDAVPAPPMVGEETKPGAVDDRSLAVQLFQLGIKGVPEPQTTAGVPFGDKFELYREVKRERTGISYLGRQINLGRLVLIRVLPPEIEATPGLADRFRERATAAGRVTHPNLVQIFEVGTVDNRPFVALEYFSGTPLSDVHRRGQQVGIRHATRIILSAAQALDHAATEGMVHGDLNLSRLVLSHDGQIRVIGLGLDGMRADDNRMPPSPLFAAPELLGGDEPSAFSDMYALGVCLFVLLTRQFPFRGEGRDQLFRAIRQQPPPRPSSVATRPVSPGLDTITVRLLQKDPTDRYKSYAHLIAALDHEFELMAGTGVEQAAVDAEGSGGGGGGRPGSGTRPGGAGPPRMPRRGGGRRRRRRRRTGALPPGPASAGSTPPPGSAPPPVSPTPPVAPTPPAANNEGDGQEQSGGPGARPRRRRGRRRFRR